MPFGDRRGAHVSDSASSLELALTLDKMPTMTVDVKWSRDRFVGLALDPEQRTAAFKAKLHELTGVEPDRQRIMVKRGCAVATEFWWLAAAAEPVVTAAMTVGNENQMKRFIYT